MDALVNRRLKDAIAAGERALDGARRGRPCFEQLCPHATALQMSLVLIASQVNGASGAEESALQALGDAIAGAHEMLEESMKLMEEADAKTSLSFFKYTFPFMNPTKSMAQMLQKSNTGEIMQCNGLCCFVHPLAWTWCKFCPAPCLFKQLQCCSWCIATESLCIYFGLASFEATRKLNCNKL